MRKSKEIAIIFVLAFIISAVSVIFLNGRNYQCETDLNLKDSELYSDIDRSLPKTSGIDDNFEEYFTNITNVVFYNGTQSSGNLDSLKYNDGDKYVVNPEFDSGNYVYNISFQYDIDLFNIPLEFYDLYLYLDIDAPLYANEYIYFQANQSSEWKTIITISDNSTHISRLFLEKCLEFRIFGEISENKQISIERIRFLIAHKGKWDPNTYIHICNEDYNVYAINENPNGAHSIDPNWWESGSDPNNITQNANNGGTSEPFAYTVLKVTMQLENIKVKELIKCNDLNIDLAWQTLGPPPYSRNVEGRIMDWGNNLWYLSKETSVPSNDITFDWSSDINNNNFYDYINENNQWRFLITSSVQRETSSTILNVKQSMANFTIRPDHDYPEVNVYSDPISPISIPILGDFDIIAEGQSNYLVSSITEIKCTIFNSTWNSGWIDMDNLAGDDYYKTFDAIDLINGNYTVWVNATDSNGLSTYNFIDIELYNSRPLIQFKGLKDGDNVINKLYNYEVQVIVNELEGDPYDNVSIMLYNDLNEPQFAKWQNTSDTYTPHLYTFKFDPFDYGTGRFSISGRAKDLKGFGLNSTILIFPSSSEKETIIIVESDDDDDSSEDQDNTLLVWAVVGLTIVSGASILVNIASIFLRRKAKPRNIQKKKLK